MNQDIIDKMEGALSDSDCALLIEAVGNDESERIARAIHRVAFGEKSRRDENIEALIKAFAVYLNCDYELAHGPDKPAEKVNFNEKAYGNFDHEKAVNLV